MSENERKARLHDLVSQHLDGGLDSAQAAELNELLRLDPSARAEYLAAMRREALLDEILREDAEAKGPRAGEAAATTAPTGAIAGTSGRARTRRRSDRARREPASAGLRIGLAAAAAVLLAVLLALAVRRPGTRSPEPRLTDSPSVAPRETAEPRKTPDAPAPPPVLPKDVDRPPEKTPPEKTQVTIEPPIETVPVVPPVEKTPEVPKDPAPKPPDPPVPAPGPARREIARVERLTGAAVFAEAPGAARRAAEKDGAVLAGTEFSTQSDMALIRFPDGSALYLNTFTRAKVDETGEAGIVVKLAAGGVYADVAPRKGLPFRVETGQARVAVKGTLFDVKASGTATVVSVDEGAVECSGAAEGARSVDVAAGQRTIVTAGSAPDRPGRFTERIAWMELLWEEKRLVLQSGLEKYDGCEDAKIGVRPQSRQYGDFNLLYALGTKDGYRSILRFDLSRLPADATVTSSALELYLTLAASDRQDHRLDLHAVRRADWVEKDARFEDAAAGKPWEKAGCDGASDREAAPSASAVAGREGNVWVKWDVTTLVRRWLAPQALDPKGGLVLIESPDLNGAKGEFRFASAEFSEAGKRPRLTIVYRARPERKK